ERRVPSLSIFTSDSIFKNWSRSIGELVSVGLTDPIWFRWTGYLIVVIPLLFWQSFRKQIAPPVFVAVLLVATFGLTIWQARWAYFFVMILVIALPALLEPIRPRAAVWCALVLSIFPILRDWDDRLWPNESALAVQVEHRVESVQLREIALMMRS